MIRKICLLIFVILLSISSVKAATLHGMIYDFNLNPVENAIVIVDSEPKQTFVAKDGEYMFSLERGEYKLFAVLAEDQEIVAKAEEKIVINSDGDFVVDLILFPSFGDLDELFNQSDIDIVDPFEEKQEFPYWIFIVIAVVGIFLYVWKKNPKKVREDKKDDDLEEVLSFIKKQGGRTTQKDIRSNSNLSEAKISLVVSELESKGLVKKIKKGRGNIIVLEKK